MLKTKNITKLLTFTLYGCFFARPIDPELLRQGVLCKLDRIDACCNLDYVLGMPKSYSDQKFNEVKTSAKALSNEAYESIPSTAEVASKAKACASATAEWSAEAAWAIGQNTYSVIESMEADTIAMLALAIPVMTGTVSASTIMLTGAALGLAAPLVNTVVSRETVDSAFNTLSSGVGIFTGAVTGCAYGTTKSCASSLYEVYNAPARSKPVALVSGLFMTGFGAAYGTIEGARTGYRVGSNFAGYCSSRVGKVLDTFSFGKK